MIDLMPEEYKGKIGTKTEYTHTAPREWNEKEIEWLLLKHSQGYNAEQIAYSMGRTPVSVSIKLKRLKKTKDTYNERHLEDKYEFNDYFLNEIQPKTILDLYCGVKSYYKSKRCYDVITNDIDKKIDADYHNDALKTICMLYSQNKKFDLIDLDPFGSAYDCFDLAIKMASKGIAITLGELGHKRWKRLDYVERFYGINCLQEFTIDNLIKHIQNIGLRNHKELEVVFKKEWENIGRVWFRVKQAKIIGTQIKKKEDDQLNLFDIDYE